MSAAQDAGGLGLEVDELGDGGGGTAGGAGLQQAAEEDEDDDDGRGLEVDWSCVGGVGRVGCVRDQARGVYG